jgi:hypothetical protein
MTHDEVAAARREATIARLKADALMRAYELERAAEPPRPPLSPQAQAEVKAIIAAVEAYRRNPPAELHPMAQAIIAAARRIAAARTGRRR